MKTRLAVALAVVVLATGEVAALQHRDAERGFSFEVPQGWKAIPQDSIDRMTAELAKRTGASVHYVGGYQLESRDDLAYPYVLVQSIEVGGASVEDVARELGSAKLQGEIQKTKEKMSDLVQGAATGVPRVDEKHHAVVITLDMTVAGGVRVKGVSFVFPGAKRAIQVHCYAESSEAAQYAPAFESIVGSFRFDPGNEYSPHSIFSGVTRAALIGAIVGAVAFLAKKIRG
jgi:hypothetical protein